jgi:putative DeoR family transcriptional regulator (stage III sporulation protein D)
MKEAVAERACKLGEYIKCHKTTVRGAAGVFNISKSTVHKDVTERLKIKNPELYKEVKKILEINKSERHIRGGMATRKKYKGI